jgi:hypothetical protein
MLSIEILNRRKPEKIKKGINPQFDMIFLGGLLHIFMAKDLLGLLPRYRKPLITGQDFGYDRLLSTVNS